VGDDRVLRKVGNGRKTNFWKYRWCGEISLYNRFPRLYSFSTQKEAKVGDLWRIHD